MTERSDSEGAELVRLRVLIRDAPIGIAMFDKHMTYLAASARWVAENGKGFDDLVGRNHYELHPDLSGRWKDVHRRAIAGETIESDEETFGGGASCERWAVAPWRDERGEVGGIIITTIDISDRKRVEDRLRTTAETYAAVLEQAPFGVALMTLPNATLVGVNDAFLRFFEITRAEVIGKRTEDLTIVDADLRARVRRELALRGAISDFEYRRKTKSGRELSLSLDVDWIQLDEQRYALVTLHDVTELRRTAERALREGQSKERLELALRGADLAMWDWDVASGAVTFNARWAEMRGYRPDEIRGHVDTWTAGVHRDDWPSVKRALEEHFAGERAEYESEHRVRTKSGEWIWILERGKVFARNERGEPLRMVGTELDVTARRRFEESLRFAEAKSSGILQISADALISIDEQQRITMFNAGAEKIFGYSKEEVLGGPLDVLIPERFRAVHREHVKKFAASADVSRRMGERGVAILGLRKSGEEFPADAAISKLHVNGKIVLSVAIRDVTEQKRVEREERFLSEVGAVLATATLDYVETISQIAKLTVREHADFCFVDIVGEDRVVRRLKAFARDPQKARLAEELERVEIDRGRPHVVAHVLRTKQPLLIEEITEDVLTSWAQNEEYGRRMRALRPRSLLAVPLRAHGRFIGVLALISSTRSYTRADLRLAEELALRAALSIENARLYRAAMRAIHDRDEVLGVVAHDLRNPLGSIVMQAAHLRREDERFKDAADKIERSARRMNKLIEDLLEVTRIEAGRLALERARVRVPDLVSEVLDAQRPLAAARSLRLQADVAPHVAEVWADRDRLLQVFENLITNAIKFTQPGGRVAVGAAPRERETVFWVSDTGPGIQAADVPHLFDRFWQARKDRRRGAGLGLPIVKGVVEAHGGRIWVESAPGQGTTFFFTIPSAPQHDEARAHPGA